MAITEENFLRAPRLRASMRESPLYQVLGSGYTDPVFLIGHADGLALNDPYRVSSIQEAVNAMLADSASPLLRAMLELYYAGARDIYLVAAAPMDEYIDTLDDRNTEKAELSGSTFYELYRERLNETYKILKEWDAADMIIPLEAPFNDTGSVDFLAPLLDYCKTMYEVSRKSVLGFIGTRGAIDDQMVENLVNDSRLNSIDSEGKFVTLIMGDGLVNHAEVPASYSASVVPSIIGVLSQLNLDRGIPYIPVPNMIGLIGKDLSSTQIDQLSNKKINPTIRNIKGRRGTVFNIVVATDNTLGMDGSDYWSLLQTRLVNKISERIRSIGYNYLGSIAFLDFKSAVQSYMLKLVNTNQIRDFQLSIQRDKSNQLRATVDISVRPFNGLREIYASVTVGPAISLGAAT